jgi:nucleoside 2-deoxyribosyltransferase
MDKKTVKKSNMLNGLRFYLAGPIDAAKDDGVGWRRALKPWLNRRNVQPLDPCDKPIAYSAYKEIEGEKQKMKELKESGRYFELTQQMRDIVHVDLRMVDVSDVVIVYLDPSISMCGTYHELLNALQQRKPTLVVIEGGKAKAPNWLFGIMNFNFMFDSFDELKVFLKQIDEGVITADLSRWVFFTHN